MTHNNHRGFASWYFMSLLFVMVFFGWHLFYFFPFLMLFALWIPWYTIDEYEYDMEKPKRKPKDESYFV